MVPWMIAIGISVAALIVTAASRPGNVSMAYTHLGIAACMAIFFALDGIRRTLALESEGHSKSEAVAEAIRSIGLVWIWAALVIAVTYSTGVLVWKEWLGHFIGMVAGALLCLGVASNLKSSAAAGTDDHTMISVSRILLLAQLVSMLVVIVGFLLDGQMKRFLVERYTDWPAKHVIFFGAIAVAALSGTGLKMLPKSK